MKIIDSYINTQHLFEIVKLRISVIEKNELELKKEKENLNSFLEQLRGRLEKMDVELKQLKGIEYELYYQIVVRGLNITKAVDKVAFDNDKDVSTIWKNYYPKVKQKIDEWKEN